MSDIIARVQKLLAMSACANANEAAAFAAAANRLIDAHRLTEADLETKSKPEDVEPIEECPHYIYESGRVNPWKISLMTILVAHYGLAVWNDTDRSSGRMVSRFKLIGRKSDIAIARYMFTWLSTVCQMLCDSEAKGKGHIFAGSYCAGFVDGVSLQLKVSRGEVQKDASASAIIKLDGRSQEATSFMWRLNPHLRMTSSRSHSRYDSAGHAAGKRQGESIHLGACLPGDKPKMLNR